MSDKFGEIFLKFKIIVYKKIDCENCGKALENLKIQEKHIVEELLSIIVNSCGVGGVCHPLVVGRCQPSLLYLIVILYD